MWALYAFGSAFFAGVTAILAKVGIRNTDAYLATALRTIVVLVFSWIMVFFVGSQRQLAQIDGKALLFLVLSGLATGGSWLCYFRALQLGDVNKVVPIDKSSTVLTILFASLFLKEPLTPQKGLCIVVIALGTWWMLEPRRAVEKTEQPQAEDAQGDERPPKRYAWLVYASGSAVFASLTAILGKVGIAGVESNLGTAIRTVVVLLLAWLIVFFSGKAGQIRSIDRQGWRFIGLSGLATGLCWMCYYKALQDGPASVVVPIDKLSIVFTVTFAFLVFRERLTRRSALGLSCIVAGTLLLLVEM